MQRQNVGEIPSHIEALHMTRKGHQWILDHYDGPARPGSNRFKYQENVLVTESVLGDWPAVAAECR